MTSPETERSGERIAKLLARAGVASRRDIERMIAEGRVRLNDEVLTTPNTVLESLKGVSVDGQPVKAAEATRIFVFHKPSGLITAERDPAGRPTIYTALRNALPADAGRVMPVGRLDFNTEGLLILTNDGELKRAMELPATGLPRTYRARTFGDVTQGQLEELIEGVEIDGMHYGRIDANMERRTGRNQWIEVTITEGKNREVRRVLEHLGLEVSRLLRTAYGPFQLFDLPRGQVSEIRQIEVERFRKALLGGTGAAVEISRPRVARSEPRREERPRREPPPRREERPRREDRPYRGEGPRREERPYREDGPRKPRRREGERKVPAGKPAAGKVRSNAEREHQPLAGKLSPRAAPPREEAPRRDRPFRDGPRSDWRDDRRDGPRSDRHDGPRSSSPRGTDPRKPGPGRSGPSRSGPSRSGPSRSGPSRSGPRR